MSNPTELPPPVAGLLESLGDSLGPVIRIRQIRCRCPLDWPYCDCNETLFTILDTRHEAEDRDRHP